MRRRLLPLALLLSAVALAASGCVFVPSLVNGQEPSETIIDPAPSNETPEPTASPEPTQPTVPTETTEPTDPDETANVDAEWPDEVPVPEGSRIPSDDDPLFYMVEGDEAAYSAYLGQLEDAGFELDYESDTISMWQGHGYSVTVMHLVGFVTVSVDES